MTDLLIILFWGAAILVLHSYVVYPASLVVLSLFRKRYRFVGGNEEGKTRISVLVSAFNEESTIEERVKGFLSMAYRDFEVIVGVDGATDRTAGILNAINDARLKVVVFNENRGKVWVLNDLQKAACGDILMFTDANTRLHPGTLVKLERHFSDPKVGGVCGRQEVLPPVGKGEMRLESQYWEFEGWLKKLEGDQGMTLGGNGAVYAIRKNLFVPFATGARIADDFVLPLKIIQKGYYFVYEPAALAVEQSGDLKGEFKRKMRIGAAVIATLGSLKSLLNPFGGFLAYSLWSHKIIRWTVPILLILLLFSNLFLVSHSAFFYFTFAMQIICYFVAAIGVVGLLKGLQIPIASHLAYFAASNTALMVGYFKALVKRPETKWEVSRS
ncbi:MAG: glycosyltransferase [Bacteroidetes bacterium]|nr:glycosyltransferase [Bacteroidota bacterium]